MITLYKAICKNFQQKNFLTVFSTLLFLSILFANSSSFSQCTPSSTPSRDNATPVPETCVGANDGQISFDGYKVATPGPFPYTWEWRKGSPTGTLLSSGTASDRFTVVGTGPTAAATLLGITASNGDLANLPQDDYYLVTCDAGLRQFNTSTPVSVKGPGVLFAFTTTPSSNPTCNGLSTGSIAATVSGGSSPYTFNWSTGASDVVSIAPFTKSLTGLPAGNYSVDVMDAFGCTINKTYTLIDPPVVSGSALTTPACSLSTNGTATVTGSGGNLTYTNYAFSNGQSGASNVASNLDDGTYTVVITDGNGCTSAPINIPVAEAPLPTVTVASPTTSTVCGLNNGSASVATTTGGTGAGTYSYLWTQQSGITANPTNANTTNAGGMATGIYVVTVTDNNGCTDTAQARIGFTTPPTVTASAADYSICSGTTTSLTATGITGGTYAWTGTAISDLSDPNSATPTFTAGSTQIFTVTGTDPATGCFATDTVQMTVFTVPTITVTPSANPICANSNVTLTASGGTTYSWTAPVAFVGSTLTAITDNPSATRTYTVTGTTNGCSAVGSVTVNVNALPTVTVSPSTSICSGNSTVLTAAGTASSYSWSPATGLNATNVASVTANPTVTTTYVVTGTAANGCTNTATTTVTVNSKPNITVTPPSAIICPSTSQNLAASSDINGTTFQWSPSTDLDFTNIANVKTTPSGSITYTVTGTAGSCQGTATVPITVSATFTPTLSYVGSTTFCKGGSVNITVNGGSTWTWSPAAGLSSTSSQTVTANPTTTTNYNVRVTSPGCGFTDLPFTITVNQPPTIDAGTSQNLCIGQPLTIGSAATAGSGAITGYSWSPATALSDPLIANPVVTPTAAGPVTYTVTVTDANLCTATDNITIDGKSNPTILNGPLVQEFCQGSSPFLGHNNTKTLAYSGGTGAGTYSFSWAPSAGLVPNALQQDPQVSPAASTVYTVTVTDANGCTDTETSTLNLVTLPNIQINAANPYNVSICKGASTVLTASGAGAFGTYSWSPALGLSATSGASVTANPTTTTTYTVTATTGQGCQGTAIANVTVNDLPTIIVNPNPAFICSGNSTPLAASGAGALGTYAWLPVTNLDDPSAATVIANPTSTTSYTVTGTDANGCKNTATVTVNVVAFPVITASSDTTICAGANATLRVTGAETYDWTPGPTGDATGILTVSPAGTTTYTVVGNSSNCSSPSAPKFIKVTVNSLPSVVIDPVSNICSGDTLDLNASGANTYAWSPTNDLLTSTGPSIKGVFTSSGANTINVIGTDLNGCSNSSSVIFTVNDLPAVDAGSSTPICKGESIVLGGNPVGLGGLAPYTYLWTPASAIKGLNTDPNPYASPITTTTFTIVVTDANGCSRADNITIPVNDGPIVNAGSDVTLCVGTPAQFGGAPTATGTGVLMYSWSPTTDLDLSNPANPTLTPVGTGIKTYVLTVTDANLCATKDSLIATISDTAVFTVSPSLKTICAGTSVPITATGVAGTTYTWAPGTGLDVTSGPNVIATPSNTITYTVTASLLPSCPNPGHAIVTINVNQLPNVTATASDAAVCQGDSVSLFSSGANTYSWTPTNDLLSNNNDTVYATPGSFTSFIVTGTDINGCVNTASVDVNVNSLPAVDAGSPQTLCKGDSIAIGGNPLGIGGLAPYTYLWTPSSDIKGSNTVMNPFVSPTTSTNFSIVVTDANGCSRADNVFVTVNDLPTVNAGTDTTICTNEARILGGAPTTNANNPVFSWSPTTDLDNPNIANPILTATSGGNKDYILTVTDGITGCKQRDTVSFQIGVKPDVTATPNDTVCHGTSITLTANGATSYEWSPGAELSATTGSSVILTPSGPTTIQVIGKSGFCSDTVLVDIVVNAPLSVSLGGDQVMCKGATLSLSPVVSGGAGAALGYSYSWSPTTNLSNPLIANPNFTPTVAGNYTFSVTVTDKPGCTGTDDINISVTDAPDVNVGADKTMCYGSSVTIGQIGSASGGAGSYTYNWKPAAGLTTPSNETSIAKPSATTDYVLNVTDGNGCIGRDTLTVNVNSKIVATATITPADCGQSNGSISLAIAGGTAPYNVTWPTTSPVQNGLTAINLTAGAYTASIADATGKCSLDTTLTNFNPSGPVISLVGSSDASCGSSCDGSATITSVGGAGTVTYSWNTTPPLSGTTATTANNLCPGNYTVTATDASGCIGVLVVNISSPSSLNIQVTTVDPKCNGGSTGTATATVTGGIGNYVYSWNTNPSQSGKTATGLSAGTYTLIVKDNGGLGCASQSIDVVIGEPLPLSPDITTKDASCFGICDGQASVSVTGGSAPYIYTWNTNPVQSGSNSTTATLCAGKYALNVTDSKGCVLDTSATIASPAQIVLNVSGHDSHCKSSDGDAQVTVVSGGGTNPTYLWKPAGETTASISGKPSGSYTVTVTNNITNCTQDTIFNINDIGGPGIDSVTATNVSCTGKCDATATVYVNSSATPVVTFAWSLSGSPIAGATASTIGSLCVGNIVATITDGGGCKTSSTPKTITAPTLNATVTTTPVSCSGGCTGTATVTATGGAFPYTYSWSTTPAQTTQTAIALCTNTYSVNVTDNNGCTFAAAASGIVSTPAPLTSTLTQTNISCNGGNGGSASITVSGGTTPYSYTWAPYGGSAATATNLIAGTYTITATDAKGCSHDTTVTITEPSKLTATTTVVAPKCNTSCDGSATVVPVGGLAPYTYSWSTTPSQTLISASALCAGDYVVTVTDANFCTTTSTAKIVAPAALNVTAASDVATCGQTDGAAHATVTGGTGAIQYSWIPTGGTGANTKDYTLIGAGAYSIKVTDNNGCVDSTTVGVNNPTGPTVSIASSTNVKCNGGSDGAISILATGKPTLSYAWSPVGLPAVADQTGLSAGSYTVAVKDGDLCITTKTIDITEPTPIKISLATTDETCSGAGDGTIKSTVTGGSGSYTYLWSNSGTPKITANVTGLAAGSYTVTVKDLNGCSQTSASVTINPATSMSIDFVKTIGTACSGSCNNSLAATVTGGAQPYTYSWNPSAQNTATATNLCEGSYTLTVTDASGCTATGSESIDLPQALVARVVTTDATCNTSNGTAKAVIDSGGTATPIKYNWLHSGASTDSISGLPAGTYSVKITDGNNCSTTVSGNLSSGGPSVGIVRTQPSCVGKSDGSLQANPTPLTSAPFKYSWSSSPGVDTLQTAGGLTAGIYTVTVTDKSGCISVTSDTLKDPAPIDVFTTVQNVGCAGGNDGAATANALNGTAPYTYTWSDSKPTVGNIVSDLTAGVYTVSVVDAKGCTANNSIVITAPNAMVVDVSTTNVTCNSGNDGSANAAVSGGTSPYTYAWSPSGGTGSSAFGLKAGIPYTLTVTDKKGCIQTVTKTLSEPTPLTVDINPLTGISCYTKCDGSLIAIASGGNSGQFTYSWDTNPKQTSQSATGLCAGNYTVTVKDLAGCTGTMTQPLSQPADLVVTGTSTDAACGASDGTATAIVTGGTIPYSYSWAGGLATRTSLAAGSYPVTVTDANGCTQSANVGVSNPGGPVVALVSKTNVSCNAKCDGTASINVTSGTDAPFTYAWNGNAALNTTSATSLCAMDNIVLVTNSKGCATAFKVPITEPDVINIRISSTPITCSGLTNATASAAVTGGTAPFTYAWSNTSPVQTSAMASNLAAGSYTVSITDANNCKNSSTVQIDAVSAMIVTKSNSGTIVCHGDCDASATVTVTNGTGPYTYRWTTTAPIQTTPTATGLCAGTYPVDIFDANGCKVSESVDVSQPSAIAITVDITNANCKTANGKAIVKAVSGAGGTLVSWTNLSPVVNLDSIYNKPAGVYNFTVTDANGCKKDSMAFIDDDGIPKPVVTVDNNVTCINEQNGRASVNVNPANYDILWNSIPIQTTPQATGLSAGTYVASARDKLTGCLANSNAVTITDQKLFAFADPTATCQGSTVALSGTAPSVNGNPLGIIQWSTNPAGQGTFEKPADINNTFTATSSGTFDIVLNWTNAADGCTPVTKNFTVTITPTPDPKPVITGSAPYCVGVPISLAGSTSSNIAGEIITWTATNPSTPTGSFSDIHAKGPVYTPAKTETGTTTLTMTISVNGKCPVPVSVPLVLTSKSIVDITPISAICKGEFATVEALPNTLTGTWNSTGDGTFATPNNTLSTYTPGPTDTSEVTLFFVPSGGCPGSADSVTVSVKPNPVVSAGPDQFVALGKTVTLSGSVSGANDPVWTSTGCGLFSTKTNINSSYTPCEGDNTLDSVIVTLTTTSGCKKASDFMVLYIGKIRFSDVLTPYPSSPGYNDFFVLPGLPDNSHLTIYDRWGLKVFEAESYKNDWDAEGLPTDTYFYILELPTGLPIKGTVTVIRTQ